MLAVFFLSVALPYQDASLPTAARVRDLVSRMTVEEKIGQIGKLRAWPNYDCSGGTMTFRRGFAEELKEHPVGTVTGIFRCDPWTQRGWGRGLEPAYAAKSRNAFQRLAVEGTRLGIPILFVGEAAHGHMSLGAPTFPTGLGLGSSFDKDLVFRVGRAIGEDCARRGDSAAYAPILDVAHDPRWSRVEECFGEDPQLVSLLGEAETRGLLAVGTQPCLKHYIGGGWSEGGHNRGPVRLGGRDFFSYELRPFRRAIAAGARFAMSTYHDVDGEHVTGSRYLLTDVLRDHLGFDGFVTADSSSIPRMAKRRIFADVPHAYAGALKAGCDADSGASSPAACADGFRQAYRAGLLSEADLDRAVSRILALKFDIGLFERPYVDESAVIDETPQDDPLALEAAEKSLVLLKNNGTLPLTAPRSVAVIGPNAAERIYNQLGDYTAPQKLEFVSMTLDGVRMFAEKAEVSYAKGCAVRNPDRSGFAEAEEKAAASDVTILVLGGSSHSWIARRDPETGATVTERIDDGETRPGKDTVWGDKDSGEGTDRATLSLSGVQMDLYRTVRAKAKKLVVVLVQGRPLEVGEILKGADAVLVAWYPGNRGGEAIGRALFGKTNPSGRLPVSIPRSVGQLPVFDGIDTNRADYVDASGVAEVPFGFGLSYTVFTYGPLVVTREPGGVRLAVDVRNAGATAGDRTVLFSFTVIGDGIQRPWRELGDFTRVSLGPGEEKRAEGFVSDEVLGHFGRNGEFVPLKGDVRFSAL